MDVVDHNFRRDVDGNRLTLLRRWLALCGLALIAATWRLWTPQVVFPQIPFFGFLCTVPGWVDGIALAGMVAGLLGLLLTPGEREASAPRVRPVRAFACLFVASLVVLILLDQHRFQPWAYQFAIVAIVLASLACASCSSSRASCSGRAFSLLRLLTIGIYFWSAVSKLDYMFLHEMGPNLLRGMLTAFGLEPGWMRSDVATAIALAFPLDELAVAGLLAFRKTRKYGLIAAVAMHLLLLATLGPWGLDHSWGVLLWNVYFIGQNVLLFAPQASGGLKPLAKAEPPESSERSTTATPPVLLSLGRGVRGEGSDDGSIAPCKPSIAADGGRVQATDDAAGHPLTPGPSPQWRGETTAKPAARLASWVVYAAVVLPVLEPFGWLDHWPGWAVYAPAGERVTILAASVPDELTDDFDSQARTATTLFLPRRSRWDLWALEATSAPIAPDARSHVGVSLAVAERYRWDDAAGVLVIQSRANRFNGNRNTIRLRFPQSVFLFADSFWLNTRPRKLGGW